MRRLASALLLVLCSRAFAEDPALPREQLALVTAATVFIQCSYANSTDPAAPIGMRADGSGFVVAPTGLIVTNRHVVAPSLDHEGVTWYLRDVTVHVNSGTEQHKPYRGAVLATWEPPFDLALVRIRPEGKLKALDTDSMWVDDLSLALTERVWAVGFPFGQTMEDELAGFDMSRNPNGPDVSVKEGSVSALRKDAEGKLKAVEHSCSIEHGNSGGPLVNRRGQVVGVNTLGLRNTAIAIPLRLVLDRFGRTMRWMAGDRTSLVQPNLRTLRVDPAAAKSDTTFATLEEALSAALAGDTIAIAAGVFELKGPTRVPGRVWVHGAGKDLTTLTFPEGARLGLEVGAGGDYTELSDLTVNCPQGPAVAVRETAVFETYLHDLSLESMADKALLVEAGGSPQVGACDLNGLVVLRGPEGRSRLAQCYVRELKLEKGSADLEACRFSNPFGISGSGADLRAIACTFFTVGLTDAKASFQSCRFVTPQGRIGNIDLNGSSTLNVNGGVLDGLFAIRVSGPGVRAAFSGTKFLVARDTALEVLDGAAADLVECEFRFKGTGGGALPMPAETAKSTTFGILVQGRASRAALKGCSFRAERGGIALRSAQGGSIEDGESVFEGVTQEIVRE